MEPPSAPPVEDHRLGTADFWQRPAEERDEVFARLRAEQPLSRHPAPDDMLGIGERDDRPFWAIVRHDDIRRISRDPRTFCSGRGVMFGDAPPELLEASLSFIAMDAPRHTKLRGLVSAAFSPRQIARIEEGIRANARLVVQEAAESPGRSGEFVELIAKRLPLMTISEMVGVPETDRDRVVEAADTLVTALDEDSWGDVPPLQKLGEALWTLTEISQQLAAERERQPRDDLMTALVQAEIDGERLTHAEIAAFFVLLAVAGNDTTRHTTSHAMRALTTNPDQRALLMRDLDATLPTAVEEFIRWATPVLTFRRTTTVPVVLHGVEIPANEKVLLFYHSGNRDERAFADPWRFDVTRDPNHHLGFGGGGPHYCLGASLARTQLRALFGELLRTMPRLEVGPPSLYRTPGFIHAVKAMDCSW